MLHASITSLSTDSIVLGYFTEYVVRTISVTVYVLPAYGLLTAVTMQLSDEWETSRALINFERKGSFVQNRKGDQSFFKVRIMIRLHSKELIQNLLKHINRVRYPDYVF